MKAPLPHQAALMLGALVFAAAAGRSTAQTSDTPEFVCRELLGQPTDRSIALNVCIDKDVELLVEYGTQSSGYEDRTTVQTLHGGVPATLTVGPLEPDTRYYYRVLYRTPGAAEYSARHEHTFHTARRPGSPFVFALEADPHLDEATNPELYRRTLVNMLASLPDFLIDLGDTFMSEKLTDGTPQGITARHLLLRTFFDTVGHSVPLMLAIGNHEGELGWLLDGTPNNLAVLTSNTRKLYYPNPARDGFYTGDTTQEGFIGPRQSYYAWEWGSALFVVLDPYWHTTRKPGASGDNWDWTLGRAQYDWFSKTLEQTRARFIFVFAHQIVGGNDTEGRGGIEGVPYYEMGGLNGDGTRGFESHRPGWPAPIHQLMADRHVTAFFHGHDHVFVRQELDGIAYQEVPQPGYYNFTSPEKSYTNTSLAAKYRYTHGDVLSSSGYLRVKVTDSAATVEYVRSYLPEHETGGRHNGEVAYSYVLRPRQEATSVGRREPGMPGLVLHQNYPNPFNPTTTISYSLPAKSAVVLAVFDVLGRQVALLEQGTREAGIHEVRWNAGTFAGGTYFCRLSAGNRTATRVMELVK